VLDSYYDGLAQYLRTGDPADFEAWLAPGARAQYAKVYRNGYLRTCIEALRHNYPTVETVVGADYFGGLARQFVDTHPPRRSTLIAYGSEFPQFIQDCRADHELDYLADYALLDRAWLKSYFSTDEKPLTSELIERLAAAGWDVSELKPALGSHAQLVETRYRASGTWVAMRDHGRLDTTMTLVCEPETTLLWRLDGRINARSLDAPDCAFLRAVEQGHSLGIAASSALDVDSDFDIATFFAALLTHEILNSTEKE
jgi:hypothetical protein